MKIVSVNVGLPRETIWRKQKILTGIFKEPVNQPVMLRTLNFDGDGQADLTVHGGANKACYIYPSEHYDYWRAELPGAKLFFGAFGENLTTEGLFETDVRIGDRFLIGEAEVVVTQLRFPCFKLNIKFQRTDMVKKFLARRRTGFYLAVKHGGIIEAGSEIKLISRHEQAVNIADFVRIYAFEKDDFKTVRRAIETNALSESWKNYFRNYLISRKNK